MQKVLMLCSFIKTIWSKFWLVLSAQPLCSLLPVCTITVLPFDHCQQVSQYLCHYLPSTAHTILPQSIITQTQTYVVFLPLCRSKGDDQIDLFSSCVKKYYHSWFYRSAEGMGCFKSKNPSDDCTILLPLSESKLLQVFGWHFITYTYTTSLHQSNATFLFLISQLWEPNGFLHCFWQIAPHAHLPDPSSTCRGVILL